MKVSTQLVLSLIILFGVSLTANAKTKRHKKRTKIQKIYRVTSCDCIGEYDGIPTFLSDLRGKANIGARSKSFAKAEAKANRKCRKKFRRFKKSGPGLPTTSGCKKMISVAGSGRWKEY